MKDCTINDIIGMMTNTNAKELNILIKALNERLGKDSYKKKFQAISDENIRIIDDLIDEIEMLQKKNKFDEADKLVKITRKLLNNNKKFQNTVGEVLSKIR